MGTCIFFVHNLLNQGYLTVKTAGIPAEKSASKHPITRLLYSLRHAAVSNLFQKLFRHDKIWLIAVILIALRIVFTAHHLPLTYHPSALTSLNHNAMPNQEPIPSRIDLFNADVMIISGCSDTTASRKVAVCRDALAKPKHQPLTIREYCDYYGYNYIEVLTLLKLL